MNKEEIKGKAVETKQRLADLKSTIDGRRTVDYIKIKRLEEKKRQLEVQLRQVQMEIDEFNEEIDLKEEGRKFELEAAEMEYSKYVCFFLSRG